MVFKNKKIIILLFMTALMAGCATVPPVEAPLPQELLLQDVCRRNNIDWNWDSVSQVVTLEAGGKIAKAMIGSNLVIVDNEQVSLNAPLKRRQGDVFVPSDFKRKVIDKMVQVLQAPVRGFRQIVIDPGHGGKDPGAIGKSGLKEKTIVLDIAQKLKRKLEGKGVKVIMTRDSDVFIPLEKRAEIANRHRADLFVSIHANSSRTRSVRGLEVYFLRNLDQANLREIQFSTNYQEMFNGFAMKKGDPALDKILLDMLYVNKQAESKRLARHISSNTADVINSMDRGSKSAGFSVLRNTLVPAVLVEVGFLSNHSEENQLGKSSYRQEIADGLAHSILDYANQR